MKYCPICETRYDEEILRFCMKDGTPLVEEDEPSFIEMPSESIDEPEDDDPGEVTVIRKNGPVPPPPPSAIDEISFTPDPTPSAQRIVIPTSDDPASGQARARVIPPYQRPPQSNTAKVVVLTIIGTLAVLAIGALGFRFLQNDGADNSNINTNFNSNIGGVNTNVNTNLGFDSNFNFNTSANFNTNSLSNINTNINANVRTPTPTPKPSPSVTPSPSPTATPDDNTSTPTRTPVTTPTPIVIRPGQTPQPPRMNPLPTNRPVNGGVLNGRAVTLPAPAYPPLAKQMRASGEVRVQVAVDERGNVISARAISGHPLLRQSAEMAARRSKIRTNGRYESGELVYNFKSN